MRHILSSRHSIQPEGDGYSGAAASHRSHSQSSQSAAALSIHIHIHIRISISINISVNINISVTLAFKISETGKMTTRATGIARFVLLQGLWVVFRLLCRGNKINSISFQVGGAEILPYGPV